MNKLPSDAIQPDMRGVISRFDIGPLWHNMQEGRDGWRERERPGINRGRVMWQVNSSFL